MKARDDRLAARGLQNDEFGRMTPCGEGACSRSAAQQSHLPMRRVWIIVWGSLRNPAGASSLATEAPSFKTGAQSSSAFTDLGDSRRLRRLRFTLLRWLTRLGPRAMATPIAKTSITTRWAMREVSGV